MTAIDIFKHCLSLGMTKAGAAGCTANILAESAGSSINVENRSNIADETYTENVNSGRYTNFINDRYGYGLCQWTAPSRKEALLAYTKSCGVSVGDASMQFTFMKKEMQEKYSTVWAILSSTDDPYNAGYVMCMQYERPANTEASAQVRGNRAKEIYEQCKNVELEMYYNPQKVIDLALSQVGYHEKASNSNLDDFTANSGDQNWNKYARDLDKLSGFYNGPKNIGYNGAWCDIFVDWAFVTAYGRAAAQYLLCQPDNSAGAGCSFSAGYFRNKGQFHIKDPKPGDQIFFGAGPNNVWHTGLVTSVSDKYVYTVEGNSSDSVARRTYRLDDSSIYGYGRPNWGTPIDISPKPATPVKMCSPKIPMLEKGSENGYVKTLQILLGERGFTYGGDIGANGEETPDGQFGSATEASVKEFQQKTHLEVDGVVGADTWAALLNL